MPCFLNRVILTTAAVIAFAYQMAPAQTTVDSSISTLIHRHLESINVQTLSHK
ncbi:hypothetical protein J5X98_12955 [Leptothermofonsia sichuanensis E412]|uniref:hypothetical protein n=1 Tax=Leptothermofonsia sichuanensis TaxID=2917832 RepID=UPI001CA689C3|nr:hypothetical protein [Leptothermofonsia sichuanensis]QZZ23157.1 hypothetical protein J5X98_12955 [Leptothermofonsia sichuanensis E412]